MLSGKFAEYTLKDVFVGRQVRESDQLINFIFGNVVNAEYPPNLEIFKAMPDVKSRTEMFLSSKNNKVKQFQAY